MEKKTFSFISFPDQDKEESVGKEKTEEKQKGKWNPWRLVRA